MGTKSKSKKKNKHGREGVRVKYTLEDPVVPSGDAPEIHEDSFQRGHLLGYELGKEDTAKEYHELLTQLRGKKSAKDIHGLIDRILVDRA